MEQDNNTTLPEKVTSEDVKSIEPTYYCEICKLSFKYKRNLTSHNRAKHGLFKSYFVCQYCKSSYSHKRSLTKHLKEKHTVSKFFIRLKEFRTLAEFNDWKCKIEDDTRSRFVIGTSVQVNKSFCKRVFKCFRSGKYIPSGKGYRKVKTKGSYKSGIVCKARIVARFYKTGEIKVKYFPKHNGHENYNDEKHLFPRNKEKSHILSLMSQGLSPKDVVEKLCNIPNYKFLTRSYIYNLSKKYALNKNIKRERKSTQTPQIGKKLSRVGKKVPCVIKEVPQILTEVPQIIKEVPEDHIQISQEHFQFLQDQTHNSEDYIYILQDQSQISQNQTWIPQLQAQIPQEETQILQHEIQISQDETQNSQNQTEVFQDSSQILQDHTPIVVIKEFQSFSEFEEWKGRIEDYANSSFVLKHSNSTSMNYSKQLYVCSRNETYKLEDINQQIQKVSEDYCKARIVAKFYETGEIKVKYFLKHNGHENDNEDKHFFPRNKENSHILSSVSEGLTDKDVIEKLCNLSNYDFSAQAYINNLMEKNTRKNDVKIEHVSTQTSQVNEEFAQHQAQDSQYKIQILQNQTQISHNQIQNLQDHIKLLRDQTQNSEDYIFILQDQPPNSEDYTYVLQDQPQHTQDNTYILQDQSNTLEDHTYILQNRTPRPGINGLPSFSVPKDNNQFELFCCSFCDKSFMKKINLIKHLEIKHQETKVAIENEPVLEHPN